MFGNGISVASLLRHPIANDSDEFDRLQCSNGRGKDIPIPALQGEIGLPNRYISLSVMGECATSSHQSVAV
ncbi:MAG: hypothetical protein ACK53Y_15825, partial [bacterium]